MKLWCVKTPKVLFGLGLSPKWLPAAYNIKIPLSNILHLISILFIFLYPRSPGFIVWVIIELWSSARLVSFVTLSIMPGTQCVEEMFFRVHGPDSHASEPKDLLFYTYNFPFQLPICFQILSCNTTLQFLQKAFRSLYINNNNSIFDSKNMFTECLPFSKDCLVWEHTSFLISNQTTVTKVSTLSFYGRENVSSYGLKSLSCMCHNKK